MSAQTPTAKELAAAMVRANYRRQIHRGKWRVVWWHPSNLYPMGRTRTSADNRATLRTVTGLKRPPYTPELWQEIVALLPAVPVLEVLFKLDLNTAEMHRRFDPAWTEEASHE
jgi:hypothetical protein